MKKIVLLIATITTIFGHSIAAIAEGEIINTENCPPESAICKDIGSTSGGDNTALFGSDGIGTRIAQFVTVIAGLVSIFVMIAAGLSYITSGGDPRRTGSAKTTIIYAAIGIIIALISQAIVSFILSNIK